MTPEEIKKLIHDEVKAKLAEEKKKLANLVEGKLLYTGQYAGAAKIMDIFKEWASKI